VGFEPTISALERAKTVRALDRAVICEIKSSVVQIEQFGCKDVEKMVGVLVVLLYLLNSCVIVFVK
jgi:hypothetical protein